MPTVLAISSFVADAGVGLRALVPALEATGSRVIAVPSVVFGGRPDRGPPGGTAIAPEALSTALEATRAAPVDAMVTGYIADPTQAEVIAAHVRARRPRLVAVDPVMGDAPDGLYVPPEVAAAIGGVLVPEADLITPNRWEFAHLTGTDPDAPLDLAALAAMARPAPQVAITSVERDGDLGAVLIDDAGVHTAFAAPDAAQVHGAGDAFTGALVGRLLAGHEAPAALTGAVAAVAHAVRRASALGLDDLLIPDLTDHLRDR